MTEMKLCLSFFFQMLVYCYDRTDMSDSDILWGLVLPKNVERTDPKSPLTPKEAGFLGKNVVSNIKHGIRGIYPARLKEGKGMQRNWMFTYSWETVDGKKKKQDGFLCDVGRLARARYIVEMLSYDKLKFFLYAIFCVGFNSDDWARYLESRGKESYSYEKFRDKIINGDNKNRREYLSHVIDFALWSAPVIKYTDEEFKEYILNVEKKYSNGDSIPFGYDNSSKIGATATLGVPTDNVTDIIELFRATLNQAVSGNSIPIENPLYNSLKKKYTEKEELIITTIKQGGYLKKEELDGDTADFQEEVASAKQSPNLDILCIQKIEAEFDDVDFNKNYVDAGGSYFPMPRKNHIYTFINEESKQLLTVKDACCGNGTPVVLSPYITEAPKCQRFAIHREENYFSISPVYCSDVFINIRTFGSVISTGQGVCLWNRDGDERIQLIPYTDGSIILSLSQDLCIAPKDASEGGDNQLAVCQRNDSAQQRWRLGDMYGNPITNTNLNSAPDLLDKLVNGEHVRIGKKDVFLGSIFESETDFKKDFEFVSTFIIAVKKIDLLEDYEESSDENSFILRCKNIEKVKVIIQQEKPKVEKVGELMRKACRGDFLRMAYMGKEGDRWKTHDAIIYNVCPEGLVILGVNDNDVVNLMYISYEEIHSRVNEGGLSLYRAK